MPGWLALLAPLAGIAGLAVGAGLLMRVPSGGAPARNPFAPLTAAGAPPLVERPATAANLARGQPSRWRSSRSPCSRSSSLLAAPSSNGSCCPRCSRVGLCGAALVAYGALISTRRLSPPALHWVRQPVRGQIRPAATLVLVGLAAITWMLFCGRRRWLPVGRQYRLGAVWSSAESWPPRSRVVRRAVSAHTTSGSIGGESSADFSYWFAY